MSKSQKSEKSKCWKCGDFLKPPLWMVISLQSLVCLRVTLHTSLCVLVTIGRARNRQLPWKQSVVDIGFNSVHYQVRPTKITITAERFYDNRHGNRWARGHGAWFNSCLYTHIHILTYTHQQLMVFLINLVSLIPFWVLRFFFFKAITVSKEQNNDTIWVTDDNRCIWWTLIYLLKSDLVCWDRQDSAMHTKSQRQLGGSTRFRQSK